MSAEVPASRSRKRIGNLVPTPTASPPSQKNPFDTTGLALNCGLWTLSGMHQSTCMTPLARMSPVQGCWQFNESSIQGQKTLSFHKPYGQTKDICPYHACVCWNTKHSDQPLAWLQRSKIIMKWLFSKKNCTWTQAWFRSFLPDSWINAASAREVKQMAWDEPRGCCRRCLQKFQPHAIGNELEILFQHLQRRRHPQKILLTPQDWPWTADCGLFQECTKAPAWRRWHEWAQLKLATKQTIIRNYAISGISAYL